MNTVIVWYFLTSSVAVAGPFTTQEQCMEMAKWAYKWKFVSPCYSAPLAAAARTPIDVRTGKTTHQE